MTHFALRNCLGCGKEFPAEGVFHRYCYECEAPPPLDPMPLTDQTNRHSPLTERINRALDHHTPRKTPLVMRVHIIERDGREQIILAHGVMTSGIIVTVTDTEDQKHDFVLPKHLTVERA